MRNPLLLLTLWLSATTSFVISQTNYTIRQLNEVPRDSLLLMDSQQATARTTLDDTDPVRRNDTVRVVGRVLVKPRILTYTLARYNIFIQDTTTGELWSGLNVLTNDTSSQAQSTQITSLDSGMIVRVVGRAVEFGSQPNSLTEMFMYTTSAPVFTSPVAVEILSTGSRPKPVEVTVDSFSVATSPRPSGGEKYEGMYVVIRNVTVSFVDSITGRFRFVDANGNQMLMFDGSGYYTFRGHRNSNSTYSPPSVGAKLSYIRGIVLPQARAGTCGEYAIMPLYPGPNELVGSTYPGDIFAPQTDIGLYRRSTFSGSFVSITGAQGPLGFDNATNITLPFTFGYVGHDYTLGRICTNGWLELGSTSRPLSFSNSNSNSDLFTPFSPNKTLAPWWDHLSPGSGSIKYTTLGTIPNRTFVVEWKNVLSYYAVGRTISFQIRLYETSNIIEFWYGPATGAPNNQESASIGIEDHIGGSGHFLEALTGSMTVGRTNLTTASNWPTYFYRFAPTPLNLLSPNGGERFYIASSDTIRWSSGGPVNVKLEYSTDAGVSWTNIIASTAASEGRYAWLVPNTPTTQAKVRISDVDSASVFDVSDTVFSISQPPVMAVSPDSLSFTVNEGDSAIGTITISNNGLGALNFQINSAVGVPAQTPPNVAFQKTVLETQQWKKEASAAQSQLKVAKSEISRLTPATLLPLIVSDPIGDGSPVDIKEIRGQVLGNMLSLQLVFQNPLNPNDFGGYLGLDVDQNQGTGSIMPSAASTQDIGCEYILYLFELRNGVITLQSLGQTITSVPATIDQNSFTFSIPMSLLNNDDGFMNLAAVIGNNSGPTDWIPDVGHGVLGVQWLSASPVSGTVQPGDSAKVTVKVRTETLDGGDFFASFAITSDDPNKRLASVPVRLKVLGNPNLVVPDSSVFPKTTYIGYPDTLRILLRNNGSDHLVVLNMSFNNTEFSTVGPTLFAVPSGTTKFINIRFNPSSPGAQSATLTITSNDPDSVSLINIAGIGGYPPNISVSPDSFSVALSVGDSATVQMTIANSTGLGPLEFKISNQELLSLPNGIAQSLTSSMYTRKARIDEKQLSFWNNYKITESDFANNEIQQFRKKVFLSNSTLPVIVQDPVGDGGTADIGEIRGSSSAGLIQIAYVFSAPVQHDSLLTIFAIDIDQNSATGRRDTIFHNIGADFYVYAIKPIFGDSATIFDSSFAMVGRVFVNRQSQEISFSVPLSILRQDDGKLNFVAVSGLLGGISDWAPNAGHATLLPEAPWLSIQPDTGSIAPSGNANVALKIRAVNMFGGKYRAVARVSSNDPAKPVLDRPVTLQVTGIPGISSSPDTLKFDQVYVGYSKRLDVVVTNNGTDVLSGTAKIQDSLFTVTDSVFSISPTRSKAISIVFRPRQVMESIASLVLTSNTVTSPSTVILRGDGALAPNIQTSISSFPTFVMKHLDTTTSSFRIRNTGGVPLVVNISDEVVSGSSGGSSGFLYAAEGSFIRQIDIVSKSVVRSIPSPVSSQGPTGMAFSGTDLYIEDIPSSQNIFVVDPDNGTVKRSFPVPSSNIDGLAYVNDKLYALEYSRNLIFVMNPLNGAKLDSLAPPVSIGGGMDGANGRLFVTGFSGFLYELNPANGSVIRSFSFGETFYGVAFTGDRLFISSVSSGKILEVNPQTGARIDSFQVGFFYALAGGGPIDAAWLTESPTSATIAAGDSTLIQIRLTPRLPFGQHRANVVLASNDPDSAKAKILVTVDVTTAVAEEGTLPREFALNQNYPNPFNPSTVVSFDLPKESHVKLLIYNVLGQQLSTLVDEVRTAGRYKVLWNATSFPSGIYFYRMTSGDFVQTKKMLLLK